MSDPHDIKAAVLESRIDGHEKVCAERYGEIKESFGRVHDRLDKIFWGLLGIVGAALVWIVANGKLPWVAS